MKKYNGLSSVELTLKFMKNFNFIKKVLSTLPLIIVLSGCVNNSEYEKALKDPITLNLVRQSVEDDSYFSNFDEYYSQSGEIVHNYYNGCSNISRLLTSIKLFLIPSSIGTFRPIACDALELRLRNTGIDIDSSSLVGYYMDQLAKQDEDRQVQEEKKQKMAQQIQIEEMTNGK